MVLDMDGHALLGRIVAAPLRNGPGHQDAIEFETAIVMQTGRRVFLDHEGERFAGSGTLSAGFRGDRKIPLSPIGRKRLDAVFIHGD